MRAKSGTLDDQLSEEWYSIIKYWISYARENLVNYNDGCRFLLLAFVDFVINANYYLYGRQLHSLNLIK